MKYYEKLIQQSIELQLQSQTLQDETRSQPDIVKGSLDGITALARRIEIRARASPAG